MMIGSELMAFIKLKDQTCLKIICISEIWGGTATINLKLKVPDKNRGGPHRGGDGYENYGI